MIRTIVLGNLPLATRIIKLLQDTEGVDLLGVICPRQHVDYTYMDKEGCAFTYCTKEGIHVYSIEDVSSIQNLDLAISARNNDILKKWFLDKFSLGIVNCHGGYLPEYSGVGGHIFPIINQEKHSGASIHFMNEKIDDGDLIDREKTRIVPEDNGFTLYKKINQTLYRLIEKNLEEMIAGSVNSIPQTAIGYENNLGRPYYYKTKDIRRALNITIFDDSTYDVIRALFWPGKELPYFEDELGRRVHISLNNGVQDV